MKNNFLKFVVIVFSVIICGWGGKVLGTAMTSTNYRIEADSINIGGLNQTSTNYRSQETIGEIATGLSTSSNFQMKAGYQYMVEPYYIALSVPSDIAMSPNIKERSGGQSNGAGQAAVITDNSAGYTLQIQASSSPALVSSGDNFSDYTPQVPGTPDFNWSVGAAVSEFGFSSEGSSLPQKFKDNGVACNIGNNDASNVCWYNLSVAAETIAFSLSANYPLGDATTLKFRAESGPSHVQTVGSYKATIILTAIAN